MTDAALILRARGGDELACRRLLDRHQDLVDYLASRYFGPGLERDDLVQEGRVGLYKATRDYRPDRDASFRHFASVCVRRQILTAVKTAGRRKHAPLNTSTSLAMPVGEDGESTLADVLADTRALEPAEILDGRDRLARLPAAVGELSDLERCAIIGIADGISYEDLAARAAVGSKAIDNAAQRGRQKLARLVGVGAEEAEATAERPTTYTHQGRRRPSLRRRPPQRRSGPTGPRPSTTKTGGERMSIADAIDAEKASVQEEIDANPSAGSPPPPTPPDAARGDGGDLVERIVALVEEHPEGVSSPTIKATLGIKAAEWDRARRDLGDRVRVEGSRRSTRYFPGTAARPNPAPPREGRAAAAPASKQPKPRPTAPPSSEEAAVAKARSQRLRRAIVELVADSEPLSADELTTMLLEQHPEFERDEIVVARVYCLNRKQIEARGDAYVIPGNTDRAQPITELEKEAVACLGAGKTAREVASNCERVHDATAARTILEALARRGAIRKRDGQPVVYEALEAAA